MIFELLPVLAVGDVFEVAGEVGKLGVKERQVQPAIYGRPMSDFLSDRCFLR